MLQQAPVHKKAAHVIVVGNEKGGSGKTTIAMHAAIALLGDGQRVGTIDLASNQKSLTRYVENRLDCTSFNTAPKLQQAWQMTRLDLLRATASILRKGLLGSLRPNRFRSSRLSMLIFL